jgi:hypothetical protein
VDTKELLAERAKTHGSFEVHARTTQSLKAVVKINLANKILTPMHAEALDMILHKIGRIVAGNPYYNDHWDDIAGYAKLASDACTKARELTEED